MSSVYLPVDESAFCSARSMRWIASRVSWPRPFVDRVFELECLKSWGRMKSAAKAISRIGSMRRMSMDSQPYPSWAVAYCLPVRRGGRFAAAAAIAAVLVAGASAAGTPGWTTYGADPGRAGAAPSLAPPVKPAFVLPLRGRVTSQVLAARDVPSAGLTTLYVTTSAGIVYALSESGYVRWRVDLGQLANECPQLDGYGVTGTMVIDAASATLYAADALGRLHALALSTGVERPGWPVQLLDDPEHSLVWGALTLAQGRVFAATGSYCDFKPFEGKVLAV